MRMSLVALLDDLVVIALELITEVLRPAQRSQTPRFQEGASAGDEYAGPKRAPDRDAVLRRVFRPVVIPEKELGGRDHVSHALADEKHCVESSLKPISAWRHQ